MTLVSEDHAERLRDQFHCARSVHQAAGNLPDVLRDIYVSGGWQPPRSDVRLFRLQTTGFLPEFHDMRYRNSALISFLSHVLQVQYSLNNSP